MECNNEYNKQVQIITVIKFLGSKGREHERREGDDLATNLIYPAGGALESVYMFFKNELAVWLSSSLIMLLL